ncbi:PD-(D/E)XK motif protein [Serratia sp. IR-2025]
MNKRAIDRWRLLKISGKGDGILEVPSIDSGVETGFGTARYAIGAQGQPRLLVPVGGIDSAKGLSSTSKLIVTSSSFKVFGKGTFFIDIQSQDRALDVVFAELAEEVLRRIEEGTSPVRAIIQSIEEFRELLKSGSLNEISENQIFGLIGELEVLRKLSTYSNGAVDVWMGPYGQRHDFRQGVHALEVKSSSRSDASKVIIHGIDQLAPPNGGTLHLVHIRIERVEQGGISIGSLFESIISLGANDKLLRECLAEVGCSDPHDEAWNRLHFELDSIKVYLVSDGFPRIVNSSFLAGSLQAGVSSLEYVIDLDNATKFELSMIDSEALWRGFLKEKNEK